MALPRLLEGITVIESANVITGPFAGMLLAHLGANVVKVEAPGGGDPFRHWDSARRTMSPSFAAYNRGKRSIVLDLKRSQGQEIYRRLSASADVVIENSRPGVMDKLGLGWEAVHSSNPSLVYCYISGLGSWGPDSGRPTYDAVAQALSGLWSQFTDLEAPEPVGPPMADQLTGLYAAYAILAGIEHSRRTGVGTKLEVSMLGSCIAFQGSNLATFLAEGIVPTKRTRAKSSQSYALLASDGLPFAIHLSSPQKFWESLCRVIDHNELLNDSRFSSRRSRVEHYDELCGIIQEAVRSQSRAWWLDRLRECDVPAAPILNIEEAVAHPQVQALGIIESTGEEDAWVRAPIAVEGHYLGADAPAPMLSANADEILAEIGILPEEIAELRRSLVTD